MAAFLSAIKSRLGSTNVDQIVTFAHDEVVLDDAVFFAPRLREIIAKLLGRTWTRRAARMPYDFRPAQEFVVDKPNSSIKN